jgi:hypothetical protein
MNGENEGYQTSLWGPEPALGPFAGTTDRLTAASLVP